MRIADRLMRTTKYKDIGGQVKTCILAMIVAVALPSEVRLKPDTTSVRRGVPDATTVATTNETKLGAGVSLKDATPVAVLLEEPETFVGKRIRIDGVATAVCTAMGCWMAVAAENDPKGATVRLKVDHDDGIVFPVTAKGRAVSAEGVFEALAAKDEEAKAAAGEHAKQDPKASARYQIKATGAVIR
jgi:hypothetical protein